LRAALAAPHPAGDHWCGRTVATWMSAYLGRRVSRQAAWRALRHLGARFLKPRPRHVQADPVAQAAFKAHLRPLLREVGVAFPQATVELWAVEEHRIGLKPILHKPGVSTGSVRWLPCNAATSGAISSASSIPPRAARSFIWRPQ
jgi:hypothetical protein